MDTSIAPLPVRGASTSAAAAAPAARQIAAINADRLSMMAPVASASPGAVCELRRRELDSARLADSGRHRHQVITAVLPPCGLVVSGRARTLLAVADRRDARGFETEVQEVRPRSVGTALAEGQVVLTRAPLVAVSLHAQVLVWALLRPIEERLQRVPCLRTQLGAVESEVDAGHDDLDADRRWCSLGLRRGRRRQRGGCLHNRLRRRWRRRRLRGRAGCGGRGGGREEKGGCHVPALSGAGRDSPVCPGSGQLWSTGPCVFSG